MLGQVLIAEADCFVAMWKDFKLPDGRDRCGGRLARAALGTASSRATAYSSSARNRLVLSNLHKCHFIAALRCNISALRIQPRVRLKKQWLWLSLLNPQQFRRSAFGAFVTFGQWQA
jgi:hypothetical protein